MFGEISEALLGSGGSMMWVGNRPKDASRQVVGVMSDADVLEFLK